MVILCHTGNITFVIINANEAMFNTLGEMYTVFLLSAAVGAKYTGGSKTIASYSIVNNCLIFFFILSFLKRIIEKKMVPM